jgi:ribonuclease-3
MTKFNYLEKNIGHTFRDTALITRALTHRSRQKIKNNERLEFLGDSVLSLVISTEIFRRHPNLREGDLSRLRAALVKGETIAKIALELGVNDYLQLGTGELRSGGQQRESILSGAFEAIIGAIYLDSNFETAQCCVLNWYDDLIDHIDDLTDVKDAKTTLQEWMQARKLPLPVYDFTVTGDAHLQEFTVICRVSGMDIETKGVSTSRRRAEQIAAKAFIKKLM